MKFLTNEDSRISFFSELLGASILSQVIRVSFLSAVTPSILVVIGVLVAVVATYNTNRRKRINCISIAIGSD